MQTMSAVTTSINDNGLRIYKIPNSVDVPKVDLSAVWYNINIRMVTLRLMSHPDTEHCVAEEDTPLHLSAANPDVRLTKVTLRRSPKESPTFCAMRIQSALINHTKMSWLYAHPDNLLSPHRFTAS
jgi:hypothetical protein